MENYYSMLQISKSIPVHVNFVGSVEMALEKVFLQVLQFLTVIIIPAVLHTDIFHLPNTDGYTCLAVDGITR
jgi:hypothetical protein